MTAPTGRVSQVTDSELVAALEGDLDAGVTVTALQRRPSRYATSATIEEVVASLDDGRTFALVLKDLGRGAQLDGARRAKPDFLHDPRREVAIYRDVLATRDLGTARCHAAVSDEASGRQWLLLERVGGIELYQVGELERWQQAAVWLAHMHTVLADDAQRLADDLPLLVHDRVWHDRWSERARTHLMNAPARAATLDRLFAAHDGAVEDLLALSPTIVHGEFYASNVLLAQEGDGERICPVDWELTAIGCGLYDLAALTSGTWTPADRDGIALAYRSALPEPPSVEAFLRALDRARLALCIQLLGWSPNWTPPPEHAHDWLAEALAVAERLQDAA